MEQGMSSQWLRVAAVMVAIFSIGTSAIYAEEREEVPVVEGRAVLGYVEHVSLGDGVEVEAILSSSHQFSELSVANLKVISVPGKKGKQAQFSVRGRTGRAKDFTVRIVNSGKSYNPSEKDVVVRLPICLGGYELTPHFRLVDRSRFEQQMRLGRRALAGRVTIDPSATHRALPTCASFIKVSEPKKSE